MATYVLGFDLVVMDGDRIALNEVDVHPLEGPLLRFDEPPLNGATSTGFS